MEQNVIELIKTAVGNYRNTRLTSMNELPERFRPYVELYFKEADKHFERVMDIVIKLSTGFEIQSTDNNVISLMQNGILLQLDINPDVSETAIQESKFILELVRKYRSIKK